MSDFELGPHKKPTTELVVPDVVDPTARELSEAELRSQRYATLTQLMGSADTIGHAVGLFWALKLSEERDANDMLPTDASQEVRDNVLPILELSGRGNNQIEPDKLSRFVELLTEYINEMVMFNEIHHINASCDYQPGDDLAEALDISDIDKRPPVKTFLRIHRGSTGLGITVQEGYDAEQMHVYGSAPLGMLVDTTNGDLVSVSALLSGT